MPSDTKIGDKQDLGESIRAAFAKQVPGEGQLVPYQQHGTGMVISDAIVTAQKVAVERDEGKILGKIRVIAHAVGEEFFYRFPVKSKGQTNWIEGPSIKCANNVARLYGNCQVDTRIVDNGDSWIIYAKFVDYETGFSYTRPFQQRKNQASLRGDTDRQLDIALQIGISKAIRNVICNALETFTNYAFEEAKSAIVAKVGKNLDAYRERVMGRLTDLQVDLHRVEYTVGRASKDWLAPDVAKIITQLQAIGDGMATVDETWPPQQGGGRPTRDQFEQKAEGTRAQDTAEQVEPFEVYDMVGEARAYENAEDALAAYRRALDEGEAQNGAAGLRTVQDNNGPYFVQLQERGFAQVEKDLSLDYGKRAEAARAKAAVPRGTEATVPDTETQLRGAVAERPGAGSPEAPGPAQGDLIAPSPAAGAHSQKEKATLSGDPPAVGETWQKKFDALAPVPPLDGNAWAVYADDAVAAIKEASTADLSALRLTDNRHMSNLRKSDDDLYKEIAGAITARVAELRAKA